MILFCNLYVLQNCFAYVQYSLKMLQQYETDACIIKKGCITLTFKDLP